jgi:hypothetical protein
MQPPAGTPGTSPTPAMPKAVDAQAASGKKE